jgi:hypothetical protein
MLATILKYGSAAVTDLYQSPLLGLIVLGLAVAYVVYQTFIHPLSKFPGPPIASLTNWWKIYHTYRLDLHEAVLALHHRYGPVVRIGPNDLHFWEPEAITAIYKAGRAMPKTEFYDSFTTFNPNLFGTTDDDVSLRPPRVSRNVRSADPSSSNMLSGDVSCHMDFP